MSEKYSKIIGKKILGIDLSDGAQEIRIRTDAGIFFGKVYGDCCSRSWVEHLEIPEDVIGSTVIFMEDSDAISSDHPEHDGKCPEHIEVYNTKISTFGGIIVIEYRNSSNGFYGGWLELIGPEEVSL